MTDPCVSRSVRRLEARDLPLPSYAHLGDAGADLCARVDVTIEPGERVLVPTGVALALPAGHAGFVHPRSGLAARHGISIVNAPGTVDAGYRGEILVNLVNLDRHEPFTVRRGDRIAQLVVQRVERVTFVEVDSLDETGRGDTGHGSTGGFGPGGAASPTRGEIQRETPGRRPARRDHRVRCAGRCVGATTTTTPDGHDARPTAGLKGRNDVGLFSRGKSKDRTDTGAVDAGPADDGFDPIEQDRAVDEANGDANGDTDGRAPRVATAPRARSTGARSRTTATTSTSARSGCAGSRAWSCASRSTSRSSRSPV